ncbi:1-aminocyclopropane-1-carboxylate deaminase/D-cysteine desulfhydrase [Planotetraspora sp. GP83]|uniref:1-aminocyclopropane-1-carboxylate deaminase/D-cysteine desulfhydrase n=1 Tax=Planotetraspora sp. GP83 TaxID=3156264 RepID=UPI003514A1DE
MPVSPLQEIHDERLSRQGVQLWLKRDDLIGTHITGTHITGNKWRKLKYNLAAAAEAGHDTLLTFGGAYSNHIRAVAAAGHRFGFATIGVIRGEERLPLNPSLAYAADHGMRLTYLDRATYRRKTDPQVVDALEREWGGFYLIPEGGSNALAVRGCAELPREIDLDFDLICCPSGTGGTLAGIAAGLAPGQRAVGFSALKGVDFLSEDVADLQVKAFGCSSENWAIQTGFHFGGFAKRPPELTAFIGDFAAGHGLVLEWVYVAKMMYGIFALVESGAIERGTRCVAVITGPPGPEQAAWEGMGVDPPIPSALAVPAVPQRGVGPARGDELVV